jgi:hypothetical protein
MRVANQRVEPMTRSAVSLLFQSTAACALLVMAHPCLARVARASP